MINFAKNKYKKVRFEKKNIFKSKIREQFDYVIINGTFNNKINHNFEWIKKRHRSYLRIQRKLLPLIIFNIRRFFDKKLFYAHPEKIFNFCKSEFSLVSLKHDYQIKDKILPMNSLRLYTVKFQMKIID